MALGSKRTANTRRGSATDRPSCSVTIHVRAKDSEESSKIWTHAYDIHCRIDELLNRGISVVWQEAYEMSSAPITTRTKFGFTMIGESIQSGNRQQR